MCHVTDTVIWNQLELYYYTNTQINLSKTWLLIAYLDEKEEEEEEQNKKKY